MVKPAVNYKYSLQLKNVILVAGTLTLGARGDSYYEYLLKQWIQTGERRYFLLFPTSQITYFLILNLKLLTSNYKLLILNF